MMDKKCNLQNGHKFTQLEPIKMKKPVIEFNFPGGKFFTIFYTFNERINDRRAFADLDDQQILDLGLSREIINREIAKPFWRA